MNFIYSPEEIIAAPLTQIVNVLVYY